MNKIINFISCLLHRKSFVKLTAKSKLETETGLWQILVYSDLLKRQEHIALVKGDISGIDPVLVRLHSSCMTGDIFGSKYCDCGWQLHQAMKNISEIGRGVILYLNQEGRGIGIVNKIRAYKLQQEEGLDTIDANKKLGFPEDLREYGVGTQILKDLRLKKIKLMTNNPQKIIGVEGCGVEIVEQVLLTGGVNEFNQKYLQTKKNKMGHKFDF